jgi:hypothetical protein
MLQQVLLSADGGEPLRHEVDAPLSVGGSRADALRVPGLPPGALRLEPLATGVVLVSRVPGLRVGGKQVPAGARRLLRPGEHAVLQSLDLAVALPPPLEGTRAAAAALLRDAALGGAPGPTLVVLDGPDAGTPLPLRGDQVIGRGRSARLRLIDPATSRRHARLRLLPGGATVEDLGAKNGLRVNGVRVEPGPIPLRPGDVLTVGATSLAYQSPEGAAAGPTPSPAPPPRPARRARRLLRAPRIPFAREPAAPLLWAILLAAAAAGLLAAASAG